MNDEVSVAELLEREGWTEAGRRPHGRMRMVAVMMAVVLGCGLAALLVHFGARSPQADGPPRLDVPHGPTGGLAGGGVPSNPSRTEQTNGDSRVVVTDQAGPLLAGVPWATGRPATSADGTTVTAASVTPAPGSKPGSTSATSTESTVADSPSSPQNSPPVSSTPNCRVLIFFC